MTLNNPDSNMNMISLDSNLENSPENLAKVIKTIFKETNTLI